MLKNKFKIIALLTIMILVLTFPVVRAEDETDHDASPEENIEAINEEASNPETTQEAEEVSEDAYTKGDVYLTGDNITIDNIIDGNLFVIANQVTINSQIGGDAFICANTVTVDESGYIFSNLFTTSENLNIKGVVYDLYALSQNVTITGYVYRDVRLASNTVNILGTVGRNAFVNCSNLSLSQTSSSDDEEQNDITSQGAINGNLNYSAEKEISIPEGVVTGDVSFEQQSALNNNTILAYVISLVSFIATVVIIWLLCLWLAPKFLKNNVSLITSKKVLPVIGFGILTPIIALILATILLILKFTSTIGILLIAILLILMSISSSIFVITVNYAICGKLKIQKNITTLGILILSSLVLWLIGLIPYIGFIVKLITVLIGIGIIVYNLIFKEKVKTDNKIED